MKPLPCLLLLLMALPAAANERLTVRVLDGGGVGSSEAQLALGVGAELARELTALIVDPVQGVSRRCGEELCFRGLIAQGGAEHGLFLLVTPVRRGTVDVEVTWMDGVEGSISRRKVSGAAAADLKGALRPVVTALVPPFIRKGWGGLVVSAESARLRVDGRAQASSDAVVPVTAGPHEVDLLLPSGEAVLTRELVIEGVRLRMTPPAERVDTAARGAPGGKGLRAASYVTFSLGALALTGSLVAGGLSRGALEGIAPCTGPDRGCTRYPVAQEAHERSGRYARAGNVLLGVGAALSTVGIGLFIFDVASSD